MLAIFIVVVLIAVAFALGYALQPRISRKISYKKRGQAARKRASVKREAKAEVGKARKLNGSAAIGSQAAQNSQENDKRAHLNGGTYDN